MSEKLFEYDGRMSEATRDIQEVIRGLNAYGPRIVNDPFNTKITLEQQLTKEGFEIYGLVFDTLDKNGKVAELVLIENELKTVIEFHSTEVSAFNFWDELTKELPGK